MTRAHSRILACIHSRAFEHSATREESRAMTASTPASASSSSVADDVERLRRIARDAAEKTHDVSRRLRIAESALDDLRGARANARVATETFRRDATRDGAIVGGGARATSVLRAARDMGLCGRRRR